MLFNSITFLLIFMPLVVGGYYALRHINLFRMSLGWLSITSLIFYAWWNPRYLLLLLTSITLNFMLGKAIVASRNARALLVLGVCGNLAAIVFYKYLAFFLPSVSTVTDLQLTAPDLLLPLAISFFTFQQIAYLVDTYRSGNAEERFDRYLLFVSFFPQLIAGPIVHHKEVAPQFSALPFRTIPIDQINAGILLFVIGLAKKVVIADQLAPYATPVFAAADDGGAPAFLDAWGGLLAYTFQLYFDFSGYADMAVGLAKMFGINLPINFDSPYKSRNIIEFWRRWHITLSHFLRDYLYIPLGGGRKGSKSLNLLVTMLLGGLWHGAGWNFVIWGGLHGAYLIINHQWIQIKLYFGYAVRLWYTDTGTFFNFQSHKSSQSESMSTSVNDAASRLRRFSSKIIYPLPSIIITFLLVSLTWSFFRAESLEGAWSMLHGAFGQNGLTLPEKIFNIAPTLFGVFAEPTPGLAIGAFPHVKGFGIIFGAMVLALCAPNSNQIVRWFSNCLENSHPSRLNTLLTVTTMAISGVTLVVALKIIAASPDSEFLYFNF